MALKYKGDRPKGTFYGNDDGVWRYTEDFPWGLWDDGWTWYAAFRGGRSSPVYLDVNGASEQNRGFRKALREIVRKYPEVAGYLISFDGPKMPVSSLVGGAVPEPESRIDLGKQTYYHGTSSDVLEAILSDGLKPRGQTNVEPVFGVEFGARPSRAEAVYLTTQLGLAQSAANSAYRKRGGDPVILEVTGLHHDNFRPDEDSRESDAVKSLERMGTVAYVGRIRPRNIRVYAMDEGSGWNKWASPARVASRFVWAKLSTEDRVLEWFQAWSDTSGYGKTRHRNQAAEKQALIDAVIEASRSKGWTWGVKKDPGSFGPYSDVVYADTPEGQVSFHVREGTYDYDPDVPNYSGTWSGKHNTNQIIAKLVAKGLIDWQPWSRSPGGLSPISEANSPGLNVRGNARVLTRGMVYEDAVVAGNASISGLVYGNAYVTGNAYVSGEVYGNARVEGGTVDGKVYGNAVIHEGPKISGVRRPTIEDGAIVRGGAQVEGKARVLGGVLEGNVSVGGTATIVDGTWSSGELTMGEWSKRWDGGIVAQLTSSTKSFDPARPKGGTIIEAIQNLKGQVEVRMRQKQGGQYVVVEERRARSLDQVRKAVLELAGIYTGKRHLTYTLNPYGFPYPKRSAARVASRYAATTPLPPSFPKTEIGLMTMDEFLEYRNPQGKFHDTETWDYDVLRMNRPTESRLGEAMGYTFDQMRDGIKVTERESHSAGAPTLAGVIHNGTLYFSNSRDGRNIPDFYFGMLRGERGEIEIRNRKQVKYLSEVLPRISPVAKRNVQKYPVILQRLIVKGEPMTLRAESQPGSMAEASTLVILNSEDLVIAQASDEWGATLIAVAREYRGRGLGKIIGKRWYELNPSHTSGGFTSAGQENALALWRDRVREFKARGWYSEMIREGRITMDRLKDIFKGVEDSKRDLEEFKALYFSEREPEPTKPTGDILVWSDGDTGVIVYDRAFLEDPDDRFIHGHGFLRHTPRKGTFIFSIDYDRPYAEMTTKALMQAARDGGDDRLYDGDEYMTDIVEAEGIPGVERDGDYLVMTRDLFPLRQEARKEQRVRKSVDPYDEKFYLLQEQADSKWR